MLPFPPCLKVDVDGVEILPKKFAGLKWGETVLDNDERDTIREETERLIREEEEQFEEDYEEYYSDDDEEDEEEDDEEDEDGLPSGVLMGYIETLGKYGFADIDKLSRLSPEDWDDLKENVGIEPDHEKHLLAGLGIKRPKKKRVKKYRKRRNEDDDEEVMGDDEEPSLESELFALAINRAQSLEEDKSPPQSPASTFDGEDDSAITSLRDRVAARKKKEGSFDEGVTGSEKKSSDTHEVLRASESGSGFKERIAARKKEAEKGKEATEHHEEAHHVGNVIAQRKAQSQELEKAQQGNESRSRVDKSAEQAGAGASMDLSAPDPKAILRQRIAARKQGETSNPMTSSKGSSPRISDQTNGTPPKRGRGSSRAQDETPKTIVVQLDQDGKVVKEKKTSPRTRAPTPGRSTWAKPATPTSSTSSSSSSTASSTTKPLEKTNSFSKPKSSRYTSPYRQRASKDSFSKEASEKREKSPRAKVFSRFIKS